MKKNAVEWSRGLPTAGTSVDTSIQPACVVGLGMGGQQLQDDVGGKSTRKKKHRVRKHEQFIYILRKCTERCVVSQDETTVNCGEAHAFSEAALLLFLYFLH